MSAITTTLVTIAHRHCDKHYHNHHCVFSMYVHLQVHAWPEDYSQQALQKNSPHKPAGSLLLWVLLLLVRQEHTQFDMLLNLLLVHHDREGR